MAAFVLEIDRQSFWSKMEISARKMWSLIGEID